MKNINDLIFKFLQDLWSFIPVNQLIAGRHQLLDILSQSSLNSEVAKDIIDRINYYFKNRKNKTFEIREFLSYFLANTKIPTSTQEIDKYLSIMWQSAAHSSYGLNDSNKEYKSLVDLTTQFIDDFERKVNELVLSSDSHASSFSATPIKSDRGNLVAHKVSRLMDYNKPKPESIESRRPRFDFTFLYNSDSPFLSSNLHLKKMNTQSNLNALRVTQDPSEMINKLIEEWYYLQAHKTPEGDLTRAKNYNQFNDQLQEKLRHNHDPLAKAIKYLGQIIYLSASIDEQELLLKKVPSRLNREKLSTTYQKLIAQLGVYREELVRVQNSIHLPNNLSYQDITHHDRDLFKMINELKSKKQLLEEKVMDSEPSTLRRPQK